MNDYKKVQEALDIIKKNGDMYDVIAQSQKKSLSKHSFWQLILLIFSRIAFLGFSVFIKNIKAFMSPVKKVYGAQEEIRKILGVNVDIVRSKGDSIFYSFGKEKKDIKEFVNCEIEVAILYEGKNSALSSYVKDLRKIYSFCKLHKLKKVLLNATDVPFDVPEDISVVWLDKVLGCDFVVSSFKKEKLEELQKRLDLNYDFSEKLYDDHLCVNLKQLHWLIKKMESFQIDKEFIYYLNKFIKDKTLNNAISLYFNNSDLSCLKQFINNKLTLFMNVNSASKDKNVGKIYQEIKISGEWIQIVNKNQEGKVLESSIVSFYNYLDVRDFQSLLKKLEYSLENKELYALVALHLYLCEESKEISSCNNCDSISLYDFYYKMYQEKKKKKISKIPRLFGFDMRVTNWFLKFIEEFAVYGAIFSFTYLLTAIITVLVPNEVWNVEKLNNIGNKIGSTCLESLEFEIKCVKVALNHIEDLFGIHEKREENIEKQEEKENDPFSRKVNGITVGDSTVRDTSENDVIATITPLKEDISLPVYFATNHAATGSYFNNLDGHSEMWYSFDNHTIVSPRLEKTSPLFEVSHALTDLDSVIYISFYLETVYPVGEHYVLTSVTINDKEDINKKMILDDDLVNGKRFLLEEEFELLSSMETPEIHFAYGISLEHGNSFANQLNNISYYTENFSEVRNAVIKGLNLSLDATNEEIFAAIKSKKYSKTPIEDAGLTEEIQNMNELEFYEAVASMDSLICNLAASLAVSVDQELIYTVGYLNYDDLYITSDEAHAWGMKNNGEIVDVTPSEPYHFIHDTLYAILWWSFDHHLPFYAILLGFGIVLEKKFGKKVTFQFKMKRTERLVMDPDIEQVYAKLNAMLYGGINFPVKRKPYEFVNRITKDFYGLTEEELCALKKELQENKLQNQEEQRLALKLIESIPFMLENKEELERVLRKEK